MSLPQPIARFSYMAPTKAEIEQARRHVRNARDAVSAQRRRLERLVNAGHPTADAEKVLAIFEETLDALRKHLAVEESFRL